MVPENCKTAGDGEPDFSIARPCSEFLRPVCRQRRGSLANSSASGGPKTQVCHDTFPKNHMLNPNLQKNQYQAVGPDQEFKSQLEYLVRSQMWTNMAVTTLLEAGGFHDFPPPPAVPRLKSFKLKTL